MSSNFQNITREELILRRIFDDFTVQNKILPHLEPTLFQDPLIQSLIKLALSGYKKYSRIPQAQDLVVALPDASAERNKLLKIMAFKPEAVDKQVAIDTIESFFKERKTESVLINAAEAIHRRDFKDIASMVKDLEEAVNFSLYMDIGLDLVDDVALALKLLNETHKAIPSSLSDVRAWTSGDKKSGGWYRSAISVFQGMPNVGKTILLCNEAAYAYQCGYNVLYVTLELGKEHIWERIAANITDIPLYKIRKEAEGDIEGLLRKNKEEHSAKCGNLLVRELPTTTTPMDLKNLINEIKVATGYNIDLLVIDYLQKMKANKGSAFGKSQSLYTLGLETSEQVRDVARELEIAALTASQVNKEGYDTTQGSMKNTAQSSGVNDTADLMVTITQDPWLQKYGMFLHTIIKNRFGPKMNVFLSECKYEYMRVRSAGNELVNSYRETQINQNIEITNFSEIKNSDTVKPATVGKTQQDVEKEHSRISGIEAGLKEKLNKGENLPKKEYILMSVANANEVKTSFSDRRKNNI